MRSSDCVAAGVTTRLVGELLKRGSSEVIGLIVRFAAPVLVIWIGGLRDERRHGKIGAANGKIGGGLSARIKAEGDQIDLTGRRDSVRGKGCEGEAEDGKPG